MVGLSRRISLLNKYGSKQGKLVTGPLCSKISSSSVSSVFPVKPAGPLYQSNERLWREVASNTALSKSDN